MAPRKSQGKKKGKQSAKKVPVKEPAVQAHTSDEEEETFDKQAILAQMEREQSLSPKGPTEEEEGE